MDTARWVRTLAEQGHPGLETTLAASGLDPVAKAALRRRAGVDCAPPPLTRSDTPRRAAQCRTRRRGGACAFHGSVELTGLSLATCALPTDIGARFCIIHARYYVGGLSSTQHGLITHAQTIVMPDHDVDTGRWMAAFISRYAPKILSYGPIEVVHYGAAVDD